jgi:hypothetical protein
MNTPRAIARVVAIAALGLTLGGCAVAYQADVTNSSNRPIEALIVSESKTMQPPAAMKFIGPNDSAVLGPIEEPGKRTVLLIVQDPGRPGTRQTMPLSGGLTAVTIQRMGEGGLVFAETSKP